MHSLQLEDLHLTLGMVFQDLLLYFLWAKEVNLQMRVLVHLLLGQDHLLLTLQMSNTKLYLIFSVPHRIVANLTYNIKNTSIGVYYSGANQGDSLIIILMM